jgi:hypothetical protein
MDSDEIKRESLAPLLIDLLKEPVKVPANTKKKQVYGALVGQFLDEKGIKGGDVKVLCSKVYNSFNVWAYEKGIEDVPSLTMFGAILRPFKKKRLAKGVFYFLNKRV